MKTVNQVRSKTTTEASEAQLQMDALCNLETVTKKAIAIIKLLDEQNMKLHELIPSAPGYHAVIGIGLAHWADMTINDMELAFEQCWKTCHPNRPRQA